MPRTSPAILTLVTSLAALTTLAACSDAAQRAVAPPTAPELSKASSAQSGDVTVMEYNLYQGTELPHILQPAPASSAVGAGIDYETMHRTNWPERAQAVARAIGEAGADLVGLSEVALWRTGPHNASGPQAPATTVDQDFVQILVNALAANHLPYAVVSSVNNFDVQATAQLSTGGLLEVRLTDRTVVIARQDKGGAALKYTNPQAANFSANSTAQTANGPIPLLEGWASVDVKKRGQPFRFISTHLDPYSSSVRFAQASEIVSRAANTSYPVIVVGDMNATPTSAPYAAFRTGGFADVWAQLRPADAGFTCCQMTEEIRNPASMLDSRIDYVFARGALQPLKIQEYGDTPAWRTQSGLWPSDHAGLAATFSRKGGD